MRFRHAMVAALVPIAAPGRSAAVFAKRRRSRPPRVSDEVREAIRALAEAGIPHLTICEIHFVSRSTVARIIRKRST